VLSAPTWSPDGRRVAFLRGHPGGNVTPARLSLFVIDADGSDETRVADCLPAPRNDGDCGWATRSGLSWSPDSTRIVFTRGGALVVYDARTGAVRPLTRCDGESCADRSPRWSPDGSEIAFARADGIAAIRPDGTGLRTIDAVAAGALAWSPDGTRLAFDDLDGISTIRADGSRQRRLIAWRTPGEGPGMPAWSPDGHRIAYFATPRGSAAFVPEVWVMDADGGTRTRLFHGACCVGLWAAPVWSPDGRWLAFAATSDKDGVVSGGTFVVAADGSGLAPIADRPVPAEQLAWQPSR
jgi:Tol biopolymer transport system component